MPVSEPAVQQKFDECFRLGVRPLDDARIAALTRLVHTVERVEDMCLFLKDIL